MRVVVLGAGFGGLELMTRPREELGDDVEVVLIDKAGGFISFPDVYAVGDVTSAGTPKARVFAEGQAAVVAEALIARHREEGDTACYDGRGVCYLEFGQDQVAKVDVTFRTGQSPFGTWDAPSSESAADKAISARAGAVAGSVATGRRRDGF